jgi:hypothetical protein
MFRRLALSAVTALLLFAAASFVYRADTFRRPMEVVTADAAVVPNLIGTGEVNPGGVMGLAPANTAPARATPNTAPTPITPYIGYGWDHPNFAGLAQPQLQAQYDPPQAGM